MPLHNNENSHYDYSELSYQDRADLLSGEESYKGFIYETEIAKDEQEQRFYVGSKKGKVTGKYIGSSKHPLFQSDRKRYGVRKFKILELVKEDGTLAEAENRFLGAAVENPLYYNIQSRAGGEGYAYDTSSRIKVLNEDIKTLSDEITNPPLDPLDGAHRKSIDGMRLFQAKPGHIDASNKKIHFLQSREYLSLASQINDLQLNYRDGVTSPEDIAPSVILEDCEVYEDEDGNQRVRRKKGHWTVISGNHRILSMRTYRNWEYHNVILVAYSRWKSVTLYPSDVSQWSDSLNPYDRNKKIPTDLDTIAKRMLCIVEEKNLYTIKKNANGEEEKEPNFKHDEISEYLKQQNLSSQQKSSVKKEAKQYWQTKKEQEESKELFLDWGIYKNDKGQVKELVDDWVKNQNLDSGTLCVELSSSGYAYKDLANQIRRYIVENKMNEQFIDSDGKTTILKVLVPQYFRSKKGAIKDKRVKDLEEIYNEDKQNILTMKKVIDGDDSRENDKSLDITIVEFPLTISEACGFFNKPRSELEFLDHRNIKSDEETA